MHCQPPPSRITCSTPDLLFKHLDTIFATYKRRQMKHKKNMPETLAKTLENHCKYMQHLDETLATDV
jgi:hypothetical protein